MGFFSIVNIWKIQIIWSSRKNIKHNLNFWIHSFISKKKRWLSVMENHGEHPKEIIWHKIFQNGCQKMFFPWLTTGKYMAAWTVTVPVNRQYIQIITIIRKSRSYWKCPWNIYLYIRIWYFQQWCFYDGKTNDWFWCYCSCRNKSKCNA